MYKYTQFDNSIDAIGNQFDSLMEDENLKNTIAKQEGWKAVEPEAYPGRRADWEMHYRRNAEIEINDIKAKIRASIAEDQAKVDRAMVKITAGDYVVQDYAKLHNIPVDEARAELDRYAASKTSRFDQNNVADKYAAMKHRNNLTTREDMNTASLIAKELETRAGISEIKSGIQRGEGILNQSSTELINRRHTSGYALAKKMGY